MGNTYGQAVIVPKTNKSGGSVAAGDVVIIDTTNDNAFTTTTSVGSTVRIGIAQETIANGATGRVLVEGHASLVNVNASVTRGHYGETYSVAKQATDAGATRMAGTFCQFTTGGTTPEADVFPVDLQGAVLTDPTSLEGDIIARGASGLVAVSLVASGKALMGNGTDAVAAYPPGHDFNYTEVTSPVTSITHTTEATADTIITASAGVAYDGSTIIDVVFEAPYCTPPTDASGRTMSFWLYDDTGSGAASIGRLASLSETSNAASAQLLHPLFTRRMIPSNATHTFSVRASINAGTGSGAAVQCGAGGNGNLMPMYLRQRKAG